MADEQVAETVASTDDFDPVSALMEPDGAVAPVEPVEPKPEGQGQEAVEQTAQQPGTPDKALQKLQQDLSATQRALVTLLDKVDAGQELTQRQQQQVSQAASKLEALRKAVAEKGQFDPFEHGEGLAEVVLEQDDRVGQLQQFVQAQAQEINTLKESVIWGALEQKYPGVKVKAVWEKCQQDAEPFKAAGPKAFNMQADLLFHSRCAAAVKSREAKTQTSPSVPSPTPITPGGAQVTGGKAPPVASAPVSEEARQMQDYLKLIE